MSFIGGLIGNFITSQLQKVNPADVVNRTPVGRQQKARLLLSEMTGPFGSVSLG
jgi:hypothetical protein